jgi:hypothetical protein
MHTHFDTNCTEPFIVNNPDALSCQDTLFNPAMTEIYNTVWLQNW